MEISEVTLITICFYILSPKLYKCRFTEIKTKSFNLYKNSLSCLSYLLAILKKYWIFSCSLFAFNSRFDGFHMTLNWTVGASKKSHQDFRSMSLIWEKFQLSKISREKYFSSHLKRNFCTRFFFLDFLILLFYPCHIFPLKY